MEIVGGFMVMMSILTLFLAVVWLIMPFVVFAIKGRQDRTLEVLENMEKRLAAIEASLHPVEPGRSRNDSTEDCANSVGLPEVNNIENGVTVPEPAAEKGGSEASPAVSNGGF